MALINTTTTGVRGTTLFADGTGDLSIQQNGVTINKVTKNPAFSSYLGSNQTPTEGVLTKIQFNVKSFDTEGCYDTTNYRFVPNVAGYYYFSLMLSVVSLTSGRVMAFQPRIYKNGSAVSIYEHNMTMSSDQIGLTNFWFGYCNGLSDYIEAYGYINDVNSASTGTFQSGETRCLFSGFLVKAV